MKTLPALLSGAVLLAAASHLPAQTPVRVTADNVNLRAKPLLSAEVVAQAKYDDRFVARTVSNDWIEVPAPATVDLWVMKQYVQSPQNTIGANRVNLRAGPSINYNIVDTLALGDTVEPRGEEVQEWLKIAPPPSAHVWISREFVEILSGEAPVLPPPPAGDAAAAAESPAAPEENLAATAGDSEEPKAGKKKRKSKAEKEAAAAEAARPPIPTPIVSPSTPVKDSAGREIPVPPPANLKLIPLEGQGRFTEVEGELRAAPLINEAPTRYRVVRWQENRWQILCHVYGEAAKLRSLQDKRVAVKGREYWIQGAAAPVLVPDQIQEVPAPASPDEDFVH